MFMWLKTYPNTNDSNYPIVLSTFYNIYFLTWFTSRFEIKSMHNLIIWNAFHALQPQQCAIWNPIESSLRIHASHFLCGKYNCSVPLQSPTHIIIDLFSGHSWGIYQRDTEGGIYQGIHHVHLKTPLPERAHKNKKALIRLLAGSEWMVCFC